MIRLYLGCATDRLAIAFVGHYDATPDHIAGALLGKMYSNITGLSIGIGIALGVSTFASQNHGRGEDSQNGQVLRQCAKAMALAYVFFSVPAAALSSPLLGALRQPPGVLAPCQSFSLVQVIGLPAAWASNALGTVLVSQGVVSPNVICDSAAAVANLLLTGFFLRFCDTGYIGAAWATTLSNWIQLSLYLLYVVLWRKQGTVWRVEPAAEGCVRPRQMSLLSYVKASLPSAFSLWAEWWAAEIQAVFAGLLPGGELSVGANGLLFNTLAICYMTFVATQIATTTRVGNLVGSKDVRLVPMSVATSLVLAALLSGAVALVLQVWGADILKIYTDEPGILAEATAANLGMVLSVPPYALMMCLLGALRGAGLQAWGAAALFVSFYILGLPLGAILGLRCGMDLLGIWYGNVVALSLASLCMGLRIRFVNWPRVADKLAQAPVIEAGLLA